MKASNKETSIAIIGIRSGSKSIPDKNIKTFCGKPLVAWIIEAAKSAKLVDRVLVSTDSVEYAEIAMKYGAEVPCLRPEELSGDDSPEYLYVEHMVKYLKEVESFNSDIVLRLQATVPFQKASDIDGAISVLRGNPRLDSVMVIAKARQNPARALQVVATKEYGPLLVDYFSGKAENAGPVNRQGLKPAYFRGNIIGCRSHVMESYASMIGPLIGCYEIPQERALDIDSQMDFLVAERIADLIFNL